MARDAKSFGELTVEDLRRFPVWESDLANEGQPGRDETWVKPVKRLPVKSMANRVVGTMLRLANGSTLFGLLGNVSLNHVRKTRQFIDVTFFHGKRAFYFSHADYPVIKKTGAAALSRFLSLQEEEIFPLTYDLTGIAVGLDEVVRGTVHARPPEELNEAQRMALIFEDASG